MPARRAAPVAITLDDGQRVSGLLDAPAAASACCVLAHGAGAGMTHPFMAALADGLTQRGIATLRYQFPYMERGSKRPDTPKLAQATVRAAVAAAGRQLPDLPLFAGGKSFGGRMTSQAQAEAALDGVHGLVFLGFPLHAVGRPSSERGAHLAEVRVPMLFLQGECDKLADLRLLRPLVERLGRLAALEVVPHADHSFHVPERSGGIDAEVQERLFERIAAWIGRLPPR